MSRKSKTKTSVESPTNGANGASGASYRYYSQAIANALRVLELLQRSHEPLALTEVSRQVNVPRVRLSAFCARWKLKAIFNGSKASASPSFRAPGSCKIIC